MKLRFSQQNYDTTKEIAMRKIILGTVFGLVFSIGAYTSAKAGNGYCEPSDPCAVWEMIQPNGDIQRIVCSPSVCGSGMFDNKVVRLEATRTPMLEPLPTFIVPTYPPDLQPTSEPSAPSAPQQPTSVEPTSGSQPVPDATHRPATEATPAPPVAGQPTQTSVSPVVVEPSPTPVVVVVATAAPTQSPDVVEVTVVGISSISTPSVSVTQKNREEQEYEKEWEPKRRRWGGEQQAI